jgi:hypothetical protein
MAMQYIRTISINNDKVKQGRMNHLSWQYFPFAHPLGLPNKVHKQMPWSLEMMHRCLGWLLLCFWQSIWDFKSKRFLWTDPNTTYITDPYSNLTWVAIKVL